MEEQEQEEEDESTRKALKHIDKSVVEMDLSREMLNMMKLMSAMGMPEGLHIPGEPDYICVLMVKVGKDLKLVGLQEDMATLSTAIDTSMEKAKEEKEHCFTIYDPTYDYLINYRWQIILTQLRQIENVQLMKGKSEKKTLVLKGMSPGFEHAHAIITEEIEAVHTLKVMFGAGMNMKVVGQIAKETREKHQCSINYNENFDGHREASTQSMQAMRLSVIENKPTKITVVTNSIEKQKADIIVNTTNKKLDLSEGRGVSWSILQAAGPSIQGELKRTYPTGIQHGEVVESSPGNIKTCRTIFHGALPGFPSKPDKTAEEECFKWLISLVFHCMIKASSSTKGFRSIAFPALGTGALNFPVQHVVQLMYRAIKLYNQKHLHPPIRDVFLVIFPDTTLQVKQLFFAHKLTHHQKTRHVGSLTEMHKEKRNSHTEPPKYELRVQVGDTLLQVVHGDIQSSCVVTDAVLVLWTKDYINASANPGLTCTNRAKSNWKFSSFVKELPDAKCTADSSNLPGTTLIHAYCKDTVGSSAVDAVVQGMKKAAGLKCTNLVVTLPTDGLHADGPRALAEVVFNAVKKTQSLLYLVTVVIEEEMAFNSFVEKLASLSSKLLPPASVDKTTLASELWEKTFYEHSVKSYESFKSIVALTTEDSVLLITSNSEDTNREAAADIKRLLNERLQQKVQETDSACAINS